MRLKEPRSFCSKVSEGLEVTNVMLTWCAIREMREVYTQQDLRLAVKECLRSRWLFHPLSILLVGMAFGTRVVLDVGSLGLASGSLDMFRCDNVAIRAKTMSFEDRQ